MVAKKPWFGERKNGWGFRPITWQGWVSVLVLVLVIVLDAIYLANNHIILIIVLIATLFIFLIVSMLKSEIP